MSTNQKPTTENHPRYTLQPKLVDGVFEVSVVELAITVKTHTDNMVEALNQANRAILDYLHLEKEKQARAAL